MQLSELVRVLSVGGLLVIGFACGAGAEKGSSQTEGDLQQIPSNEPNPELFLPSLTQAEAPASYQVRFETTKGEVLLEMTRAWSPAGCDRFHHLVKIGYFDDVAFYRVLEGYIAQFGVHGNPEINALWAAEGILDDPRQVSNERGCLTFAQQGTDSRTTQLFINLADNSDLDDAGFAPIGRVVRGMDAVDSLYSGYGEMGPKKGKGPLPTLLSLRGNEYLKKQFPELDYITSASIVE